MAQADPALHGLESAHGHPPTRIAGYRPSSAAAPIHEGSPCAHPPAQIGRCKPGCKPRHHPSLTRRCVRATPPSCQDRRASARRCSSGQSVKQPRRQHAHSLARKHAADCLLPSHQRRAQGAALRPRTVRLCRRLVVSQCPPPEMEPAPERKPACAAHDPGLSSQALACRPMPPTDSTRTARLRSPPLCSLHQPSLRSLVGRPVNQAPKQTPQPLAQTVPCPPLSP